MATAIREVLERRNDLSTFVVHLTRGDDDNSGWDNLLSIAASRRLEARTPMGFAYDLDNPAEPAEQSQRVVCFTETPLEHLYQMVRPIEGRRVRLEPYGLAFTKLRARKLGINPIVYVDMTPGRDWELQRAFEQLRELAETDPAGFHRHPASRILPFTDQMGTWPNSQKEFWWEREWRHRGALDFGLGNVALWLCPEDEIEELEEELAELRGRGPRPRAIDPRWGVERIVANLVGHGLDLSPFD